jgi:hypothetical protein
MTSREIQRNDFVKSLHGLFRQQAQEAKSDHDRFVKQACTYIDDGLEDSECVELLIIDGLSREAAQRYVDMVHEQADEASSVCEYCFTFEDIRGRQYTSYDIGMTVTASSEDEAWGKAEYIMDVEPSLEIDRIISVDRTE